MTRHCKIIEVEYFLRVSVVAFNDVAANMNMICLLLMVSAITYLHIRFVLNISVKNQQLVSSSALAIRALLLGIINHFSACVVTSRFEKTKLCMWQSSH